MSDSSDDVDHCWPFKPFDIFQVLRFRRNVRRSSQSRTSHKNVRRSRTNSTAVLEQSADHHGQFEREPVQDLPDGGERRSLRRHLEHNAQDQTVKMRGRKFDTGNGQLLCFRLTGHKGNTVTALQLPKFSSFFYRTCTGLPQKLYKNFVCFCLLDVIGFFFWIEKEKN